VNGVHQIVRLDDAVAVVADHMGAAKKGLAALVIEWDDGPHARLSTKDIVDELEHATLNPGAVAETIGDVSSAMAKAVTKVEAIYQVPFLAHATMEPMVHGPLCVRMAAKSAALRPWRALRRRQRRPRAAVGQIVVPIISLAGSTSARRRRRRACRSDRAAS
jgi:hypothetical protein